MKTRFTEMLGVPHPIIAGPMFLVSDETLVEAACAGGIVGACPSLNWRTSEAFRAALKTIKEKVGSKRFAVNLIVNKSNIRVQEDLKSCLDAGVPMFITSLGNPKEVIKEAHAIGSKVFCDVVNLEHAKKVEDLGADGVIAVSQGAGGHAGPISPLVLIPYLKKHLRIPVVAAGGIATGRGLAAALALGASAVQIGTRFIASTECKAHDDYKAAIVRAEPEDIVMTSRISGTPASVIKTASIDAIGLDLNPLERWLLHSKRTKKWAKLALNLRGMKWLEAAAVKKTTTWKQVWSAGQAVGLIDKVEPVGTIIQNLIAECEETLGELKSLHA